MTVDPMRSIQGSDEICSSTWAVFSWPWLVVLIYRGWITIPQKIWGFVISQISGSWIVEPIRIQMECQHNGFEGFSTCDFFKDGFFCGWFFLRICASHWDSSITIEANKKTPFKLVKLARDLTQVPGPPKGSVLEGNPPPPLFQGNLGWWTIIIWPEFKGEYFWVTFSLWHQTFANPSLWRTTVKTFTNCYIEYFWSPGCGQKLLDLWRLIPLDIFGFPLQCFANLARAHVMMMRRRQPAVGIGKFLGWCCRCSSKM